MVTTCRRRRSQRPPRQDAEGRIDDSKACEGTDTRIQYHIAWEGFPDPFPDWWQQLEHAIAATVLSQPEPYRSKIVELECGGGDMTQCLIVDMLPQGASGSCTPRTAPSCSWTMLAAACCKRAGVAGARAAKASPPGSCCWLRRLRAPTAPSTGAAAQS